MIKHLLQLTKPISQLSSFSTSSTTLTILTKNKTSLNLTHPKLPTHPSTHAPPRPQTRTPTKLLPYLPINTAYFTSIHLSLLQQFKELDVFRDKVKGNLDLAYGEDFQDYPLGRVLNIGLRMKREGCRDRELWGRLERRVIGLFRNTSAVENILLFYISVQTMSQQFQAKILSQLQSQLKSFTQLERQLLFYTLCLLNPNPTLNKLKQDLLALTHRSKLPMSSLVQWITMVTIGHAGTLGQVLRFYEKVFLYDGDGGKGKGKYQIGVQQFCGLLRALEARAVLADSGALGRIREMGRKLIELYQKQVANSTVLLNTVPDHLLMKILLNYYNPSPNGLLSSEQFLTSPTLTSTTKLQYLYWIWKNDYMQIYEIKSLYESISLAAEAKGRNGFAALDLVYHACLLDIALRNWGNCGWVVDRADEMDYVPNGLQWPLWNYLAYVVKGASLTIQQKEKIEKIIKKISQCSSLYDKSSKLASQQDYLKSTPDLQQIIKFFHSIRAWPFQPCEPIGNLDYIAHFVNHEMKIVIHCLQKEDFIEPFVDGDRPKEEMVNNRHSLDKKMLKENFGYQVIDLRVGEFMKLNYGDRVQWLRERIAQFKLAQRKQIDK